MTSTLTDINRPITQPLSYLPNGFDLDDSKSNIDSTLSSSINKLSPVGLDDIQHAALLKRVESKFVFAAHDLAIILDALQADYNVLEIEGQRLNRYSTLYFDTPDFLMYRQHHANQSDRFKVRMRTYLESGSSFLEIKHKTNRKQTIKSRIQTDRISTKLREQSADFVQDIVPFEANSLVPRLWNKYQRITLVSKSSKERVTIDTQLAFDYGGKQQLLPGLIIAEVKQERLSAPSKFKELMREFHYRSTSFSKYCIGASLLYPQLKKNRFKPKYRLIKKITQGGASYGTH